MSGTSPDSVSYPVVGYGLVGYTDGGTGFANYLTLDGAAQADPVVIQARGLADNIDIELRPKGTGRVIWEGASAWGTVSIGVDKANYVTIAGGTTGNPVTFTSVGGDASPDIRFVLPDRGLVNIPRLAIGNDSVGATTLAPRLFSMYSDQTVSGTPGPWFRAGGILRGTASASIVGLYSFLVDEDRLNVAGGEAGYTVSRFSTNLRNGWYGGRTVQSSFLTVGDEADPGNHSGLSGSGEYLVSGSSFAYSYTEAGGRVGDTRGNLFARNDATRVRAGSGYHWNSTYGTEIDVGVAATAEVQWKGGLKIVQWSDDATRGSVQDFAFGINTQAGGSPPGWRVGLGLGAFEGWWPFSADSTVMKALDANNTSGPAKAFAVGIDFRNIAIGVASHVGPGYQIDGSGNLGALVASGVALQTRSALTAATAVVASATVIEGGLYVGAITLTGTAPTTSGTTATFSVATVGIAYANNIVATGSGYAVNDPFTVTNGTGTIVAAGFITKVDNDGGALGIKLTTVGSYSVPPTTATTTATSGAGSGMTFTPRLRILTVTVTNAGTNYSEWLPPTITSAGATATYRQALIKVAMTATAAPLVLANNYANYLTVTGGATSGSNGSAVLSTGGSATNSHLDLSTKGASSLVRGDRPLLFSTSSSLDTLTGLRAAPTAVWFHNNYTYTAAASPVYRWSGNASGSITSGTADWGLFSIDADTVDPTTGSGPGGMSGFRIGHTLTGGKGGRTALSAGLFINGAFTSSAGGNGSFQVAGGFRATASASAGGSSGAGNQRGNLFGINPIALIAAGSGLYWDSVTGAEINVGAEATTGINRKTGLQIVQWSTDAVAGASSVDTGLLFITQTGGSRVGWDVGISFGNPAGWWPMKAAGTLIGTATSYAGGVAYEAAWGIDLSAVTFSSGFLKSTGYEVDGSGRVKLTVYGNFANDAAAAAGGTPVTGVYRNGSVLMIRVV